MTAKVLVVEDEADVALVIRVNLERAGYEVVEARNGQDGVDLADTIQPDLILLDVMMPVMDGFTTLRELQEDPTTEDIPVVMLTALSGERDIIRGHLQGAVRYLTKPFDVDVLLTTVAEAVAPVDAAERTRRVQTRLQLLRRLAELETGRSDPQSVRVSRLDRQPREADRELTDAEVERVARLTDRQHLVAAMLAEGVGAREIADRLGVSRSNVYATRKRIARKLAVEPDDVAAEAKRLGIVAPTEDAGQSGD
ncbi:MAG: DNA-binding response regulator [Nitriliruptorales bacterium]|nr:DNA-binding response regulator [Nitriliruptorales bacterium]